MFIKIRKNKDKKFIFRWFLFLSIASFLVLIKCNFINSDESFLNKKNNYYAKAIYHTFSKDELNNFLEKIQVLLVGEIHDYPVHHQVQLELLKFMENYTSALIVGIEWLDHTVQLDCDRLSAGYLTVEEFVRLVEWDRNWGFALDLYAPILEYVREHHLRLVALNAPFEIVRQIANNGLFSLTLLQRSFLAPILELQDRFYRFHLDSQFFLHRLQGITSQENFFIAQIIRDETMAHILSMAMSPWPDNSSRAIVLAGSGHLAYGEGLPSRIRRRLPGVALVTALSMSVQLATSFNVLDSISWPADILILTSVDASQ